MDLKSPSGDPTLCHINIGSCASFCASPATHPQWGHLLPLQTVHLFYLKIWLFIFKFLNEHSNLIVTDPLETHSEKFKSSYLLGSILPSMYFPMIDPDLCFQLAFGTVVLHFCRNTEYFLLIYFCCSLWLTASIPNT